MVPVEAIKGFIADRYSLCPKSMYRFMTAIPYFIIKELTMVKRPKQITNVQKPLLRILPYEDMKNSS